MTKSAQHITRRRFLHRMGQIVFGCATLPLLQACSQFDNDAVVINIHSRQPQSYFDPSSVSILQGTQVVWHNIGVLVHSVTCDPELVDDVTIVRLPDGAEAWTSEDLYTGDTYARTFNTPGNYIYTSRFRRNSEMIGTIRVLERAT